jgi:pyruvate/2-oxoglutarate dehydrogenase complex dihydrolipoamide acyltransferase (E2) component
MTPVELPKANENLTEATLSHWLVNEGQWVVQTQSLCVLITDKATFEMPSPAEGLVRRIYQKEKSLLPVGYVLCAIGAQDEQIPDEYEMRNRMVLSAHHATTVAVAPPSSAATAPVVNPPSAGAVRATPAARRIAKESGVELAEVARALNLQGPVNEKDVRAFVAQRGKPTP